MPRPACPSSGSNAVLIQRAIIGDGAAFLELTGRYEGLIRHIGFQEFHLAGADLQDLVQDIFLLLLRDNCRLLEAYKSESLLSTWLGSIVRHRCVDRKRHLAVCDKAAEQNTHGFVAGDQNIEKQTIIREALTRLSVQQRRVVYLYFFDGYTYAEIAHFLQVPQNTIGSHLFRARSDLREILGDAQNSTKRLT